MSAPRLNVTLHGTTNPYLTLPCRGEIELFELGVDGRLISAVFRAQQPDGSLGAPVQVAQPVFTYAPRVSEHIAAGRRAAAPAAPAAGRPTGNYQLNRPHTELAEGDWFTDPEDHTDEPPMIKVVGRPAAHTVTVTDGVTGRTWAVSFGPVDRVDILKGGA